MSAGGKREGAGRKAGPARVAVTVRISPKSADKLNAYVEAKQSSQAREIEAWALRLRVPVSALPNAVVSHTGALPEAKISNQVPSPGVGL